MSVVRMTCFYAIGWSFGQSLDGDIRYAWASAVAACVLALVEITRANYYRTKVRG